MGAPRRPRHQLIEAVQAAWHALPAEAWLVFREMVAATLPPLLKCPARGACSLQTCSPPGPARGSTVPRTGWCPPALAQDGALARPEKEQAEGGGGCLSNAPPGAGLRSLLGCGPALQKGSRQATGPPKATGAGGAASAARRAGAASHRIADTTAPRDAAPRGTALWDTHPGSRIPGRRIPKQGGGTRATCRAAGTATLWSAAV